jgi:hypothetical protein
VLGRVELGKVEPKQKEKSFKLASELTGEEGMVEADTWVKVLQCCYLIVSNSMMSRHGLRCFK